MAINYASKYSDKVDEKFKLASVTTNAVNNDYDFVGVNAVNVYSIPTSALNDYTMTGTSRYGTPEELQDQKQTLVMSQDKAFTFTVDRRNLEDTMMTKEVGKALARQIDEVITPHIDSYRLGKMVAGAGTSATPVAITASNAYTSFLDGVTTLLDKKVPLVGAVAYITSNFYKQIRLDSSFIKPSDMAQDMLSKGVVGMVEGIPLIHVPSSYLPEKTEFLITNRMATVAPVKLAEYTTHENPPGINGTLVEGRIYFDAFVLDNKKPAIYVHKSA